MSHHLTKEVNESREENFGSLAWIAPDVGVLTFVVWDVHPDVWTHLWLPDSVRNSSHSVIASGGGAGWTAP